MKKFILGFGCLLFLTGCGNSNTDTPVESAALIEETVADFSLEVVQQKKAPENKNFVEEVAVVEAPPAFEIVKSFEDFSSSGYDSLKGVAPFTLFFTQEDCERCDQMDQFFSQNLSTFPNPVSYTHLTLPTILLV